MVILVEGGELMQFLGNLDRAIVTENEIVCVWMMSIINVKILFSFLDFHSPLSLSPYMLLCREC